MRLTGQQRHAIRVGRPAQWLGHRETGVEGSTMVALQRRGLADVQTSDRRFVYRLTQDGNALRLQWAPAALEQPVAHQPIRVRCVHCGAEFPDGTHGGSCGDCGQLVEAIA